MTSAATTVHGTVTETFERVRDTFTTQFELGTEVGASLVVEIDDQRVVDLWGGHRDAGRSATWQRDTVVNVWSISKMVTSLAALMLVDSGDLDVHAPVVRYWPEFGAEGKDRVEVRHLLSHTSGVAGLDRPAQLSDLFDVRESAARMAAQAPWWEPGSASGYHILNYGHLIGELVTRLTGMSLRDFVHRQIATPLGADFQIGLRTSDVRRVAQIVVPPADFDLSALDPGSVVYKAFTGPAVRAAVANTEAWRAADLGAANGHGNARSVAQVLGAISRNGESPAGRILTPSTIDLIFEQQSDGVDLVNGIRVRRGIGYALSDPRTLPWLPTGRVAFWGGWGGSMAIMDLDRRLTIAYVMNRMGDDILGSDRAAAYVSSIYESLGG